MTQSIRRTPPPNGGSYKRPHFWKEGDEWFCVIHGISISWDMKTKGSFKDYGKKPEDALRRVIWRIGMLI